MRRLSKEHLKRQGVYCQRRIASTSIRNILNLRHARCGASRTLSPVLSRSLIRFRSSRRQRNWVAFWQDCEIEPNSVLAFEDGISLTGVCHLRFRHYIVLDEQYREAISFNELCCEILVLHRPIPLVLAA